MKYILIFLMLLTTTASAADTTHVRTQLIFGNHDTLSNASVTFELYGVSSVIDTAANLPILCKPITVTSNDTGFVGVGLVRNENLLKQKSGAVNPWWKVTVRHSTLAMPLEMYFHIDADSTGTFSFGINSDAVQFVAPK